MKDLQLGLVREIDEAERWLRSTVGDAANGSPALAELQGLRVRAQSAVTAQERTAIQKELSTWKRSRMDSSKGASPQSP